MLPGADDPRDVSVPIAELEPVPFAVSETPSALAVLLSS
jgi:hypothetical protein